MRSPLRLLVIGAIAAIVMTSAVYWVTQNSNEQPLRPGDYHVTLTYKGLARSYILHVPPQYDGNTSLPLVIALHYLGVDAETFANVSHLNEKADAEGFFVAYPQGLNNSWNAGSCCGSSSQQKVDDAGFIKAILVQLKDQLPVNDSRVYTIGVSNGGMLAYSLACDFPEEFAAIASIAGTSVIEGCDATRPVSVLEVHGTADEVVPYNNTTRNESVFPVPPAVDAISYWAQHDRTISVQRQQVTNNVTETVYSGGSNGTEVVLYTIVGATHSQTFANTIPTLDLVWRFLKLHPRQSG